MNPDTLTFADTDLAQKLTKDAYPNAKQITLIEHGYDNIVMLVDELYALRFPRNQDAYARSQYEKQVLQHLETLETISVPKILGEHANPPYLLTSFVAGKHLSPKDINNFPAELQQELGESIAAFAHGMHTAFSVEEARRIRKELRLDERPEEPWNIFFKRLLAGSTLLTPEQDAIAKEYYKKWKQANADSPLVIVHDDLHTENMLFKDQHLCGILDFGDTNIGTAEQDLRQLYRLNEVVLNAAANKYSELSGRQFNTEAAKTWAIMQELSVYTEQLLAGNTTRASFARASKNLNTWLKTDIWGKGLFSLSETASYQ